MNKLKIAFIDIETTPNISYTWGKYEQDVIDFKKEWELLTFSYKFLGEKEVHGYTRLDFKDKTDKSLVKKLKEVMEDADILVAHNGIDFDFKKANAKFIEHDLGPLPPKQYLDTKRIAKKYFKFNSNKLNDLGRLLGLGEKLDTGGFDLWLQCMAGNKSAVKKMLDYNKQDVILLEKVYLRLRPWVESHPNVAFVSTAVKACPKCGSPRLKSKGIIRTKTSQYRKYICLGCGGYSRGRIAIRNIGRPEIV